MGRARSFDDQDVLERATRLFWRQGYKGTSMRDLVEATGLAKASIYNAFGTKEDLFKSVLSYYIDNKQTHSLSFLEGGSNGREALLAYFNNVLCVTLENQSTAGCLLVNTATEQCATDTAMKGLVDHGMERTQRTLISTVTRGIEDGSIAPSVDAETAGLCLMGTLLAIRVMARKGVDTQWVTKLIRANLEAHIPVCMPSAVSTGPVTGYRH
ncbi:TetR/AcrR family transcriptional regulator [Cohaesibacter intestini]|uniref:TetR/AcrR family transcriptional regulator n=1 Tax=Cohaesibacter intestini TaxID=2211145 RepID=UPI000DE921C1|nr:TetR/AcrR family transcriptional regulator [Cohaesibacter intestini]